MTDAEWICQCRKDAEKECARCPGKKFDCCSWQCRYFKWTATEEEKEAVLRSLEEQATFKVPRQLTKRERLGPVQPAGFTVAEPKETEVA